MAIISAGSMIRSLSLFHLTLAALLLKNPKLIANQSVVLVLGGSMQLVRPPFPNSAPSHPLKKTTTANTPQPMPRDFSTPSAALAFVALLFAFLGISDLTAASLDDEIFDAYWGAQTPVRLVFLFLLTGYTVLFKKGGLLSPKGANAFATGPGDYLKNSFVFAWGFIEISAWFWIFVTLREERRERARKIIAKRQAEAAKLEAEGM
jgi:hypothetical protein